MIDAKYLEKEYRERYSTIATSVKITHEKGPIYHVLESSGVGFSQTLTAYLIKVDSKGNIIERTQV